MRNHLQVALLFVVMLHPAVVVAEPVLEPGDTDERVAYLQDGGVFRGELVELEPRSHLTLRLTSGKLRRFEWRELKRIASVRSAGERLPVASPSSTPSELSGVPKRPRDQNPTADTTATPQKVSGFRAAAEQAPQTPLHADLSNYGSRLASLKLSSQLTAFGIDLATAQTHQGIVGLTIDSPVSVRLNYVHDKGTFDDDFIRLITWGWPVSEEVSIWRTACKSPCESWLYRGAEYKLQGPDITSVSVEFPSNGKRFKLDVRPGSPAVRTLAWTAVGLGALQAVIGGVLLGIVPNYRDASTSSEIRTAAIAVTVSSVGTLLLSIPLFIGSRTKYRMDRID